MTSQPSLGALNPPSRSVRALASFWLSSLSAVAWLRTCLAQDVKRQAPSAMCTPPSTPLTTHHPPPRRSLSPHTHFLAHQTGPGQSVLRTFPGCATANRGRGAHTGDFSFGARRRQRGAACLTSRDPPNGLPPPRQPPPPQIAREPRAESQEPRLAPPGWCRRSRGEQAKQRRRLLSSDSPSPSGWSRAKSPKTTKTAGGVRRPPLRVGSSSGNHDGELATALAAWRAQCLYMTGTPHPLRQGPFFFQL
ncbi:hypothetical protein BGZ61DRAFT_40955 [Ilyonectria robusta]|uniref:uncharacterized protein n=1 Tax=Ilyonectria robusta TaxID=1079257 RepID=UPI001E8CBEA7|nr:uncharacterized protein BGZ61DRAFT_40955 [Ilyonectria robusta]KAH8688309.1 hypothetical protein BGZ61DRAFT_40955 [Ilyonectria robusta]